MNIRQNSNLIEPGDTFVSGIQADAYIDHAIQKGADRIALVDNDTLGDYLNQHFLHISKRCKIIGITGTNGKTTVATLVAEALTQCGKKAQYLGTLNSELTTPDASTVHSKINHAISEGCKYFVMEASSHGIAQNRLAGINFHITALTNITHEHLDYHKSFEEYEGIKKEFLKSGQICIGPDQYTHIPIDFEHQFWGDFNQENLQLTKGILRACGLADAEINEVLATLSPPPGRFERISSINTPLVFVDFAHTPDSLDRVLETAKKIARNENSRLTVVFGCGGDRDTEKRPLMGQVASKWADSIVITADNPRSEAVSTINDAILTGVTPDKAHDVSVISDRKAAIRHALNGARPRDVVVLAGKGHETVQIIGTDHVSHNDKQAAIEAAKEIKK